jgi:hypothetical protein
VYSDIDIHLAMDNIGYIYIYVFSGIYIQCFINILADMFEGIIFECCAWFWDHVFFHMFFTHCYSCVCFGIDG